MDMSMRKMLVCISNLTRPEDLKTMKFFCKDIIPTKSRDEIESGVDLFEKLEERGKIKPGDLSFLELLLENTCAGRTDLVDILNNFKQSTRPIPITIKTDVSRGEGLSPVFSFLCKNLGRHYLMFLRRLGVPDSILDQLVEENPRNVQEVIQKALSYWYQANSESACKEDIIRALQAERRNDLVLKIVNCVF